MQHWVSTLRHYSSHVTMSLQPITGSIVTDWPIRRQNGDGWPIGGQELIAWGWWLSQCCDACSTAGACSHLGNEAHLVIVRKMRGKKTFMKTTYLVGFLLSLNLFKGESKDLALIKVLAINWVLNSICTFSTSSDIYRNCYPHNTITA